MEAQTWETKMGGFCSRREQGGASKERRCRVPRRSLPGLQVWVTSFIDCNLCTKYVSTCVGLRPSLD